MRNFGVLPLDGDREGDLFRLGEGGGFLKSMWGISLVDGNRGTDFALSFLGEVAAGENNDGGGLALTVEKGFPGVADRFLADRRPGCMFGSEWVRECVCPRRLWSRMSVLTFSISLWVSPTGESRLTRLRALASGGVVPVYSSCGGGDAERLELLATLICGSFFRGESNSSSSLSSADIASPAIV